MKIIKRLIGNYKIKPPTQIELIKLRGFKTEIEVFVNRLEHQIINEKVFILEVKNLLNRYKMEEHNGE